MIIQGVKTQNSTIQQTWFNISEAAEYIGVSHDTLRRWEKKGKLIPRRTVGKHRRYSKKQLENILKKPPVNIPKIPNKTTKHIATEQKTSANPQITKIITPETSQYTPEPQISKPTLKTTTPQPQITTQITQPTTKVNLFTKLKTSFRDTISLIILVVILFLLTISFFLLRNIQQPKNDTTLSPIPSYNELK
jgi:excisionase family DNA binding protein